MEKTIQPINRWTASRIVWSTVFVVGVLLAFWLVFRLLPILLIFFAAIVLGTAIRPGVEWMRERGVLRPTGVIVIYILLVVLLVGFFALVAPFIANQVTQFSQNISVYYSEVRNWMIASGNQLLHNLGARIPSRPLQLLNNRPDTGQVLDDVARLFLYAGSVAAAVIELLAVFLLAYYWTQEGSLVIRTLLRFVPPPRRAGARDFIHRAEERIGGYIRAQGLLCLIIGSAALVAYLLIGLPFALVLGILAGLTEVIPIVGPALGALPAVMVALSVDPSKVPWVLAAVVLIQLLENTLIVPRLMKNTLGVNPILTILTLMTFGSVLGFFGALLALPSAAMIQLIIDRMLLSAGSEQENTSSGPDVDELLVESQQLLNLAEDVSQKDEGQVPTESRSLEGEMVRITRELNEVLASLKAEEEAGW
ncbi:MAG TPA: AI-2E family transporter [Anaerolineales bacterium]